MGEFPMIRYDVYFSGRVQGVGFRATTRQIARGHRVAGYVRNEPDGRVRLEIEGDPADCKALLHEILDVFASNITSHTLDQRPPTGEFGPIASGRDTGIAIRH